MKFNCTKEDIKNSSRCKSSYCPIANCIKRTLNVSLVKVNPGLGNLGFVQIVNQLYYLPEHVNEFAICFDTGKFVEPIEFELNDKI